MALVLVLFEVLVLPEETEELEADVEAEDDLLVTEPELAALVAEPELELLVAEPELDVLEEEAEIVLSVEGLLAVERLTEEALVRVVLLTAVEAEVLLLV